MDHFGEVWARLEAYIKCMVTIDATLKNLIGLRHLFMETGRRWQVQGDESESDLKKTWQVSNTLDLSM